MKNFKNRSDRRGSYKRGGDRGRREVSLYDAVCDQCGKDCQVPFKPSGDKPIYCSDCFEKRGGKEGRSDRQPQRRSFDRNDRPQRSQPNDRAISELAGKIGILNSKLDAIIGLLSTSEPKEVEPKKKGNKSKKEKSVKK